MNEFGTSMEHPLGEPVEADGTGIQAIEGAPQPALESEETKKEK